LPAARTGKIQALQQEKAALAGAVLEGGTTGGFKLEQTDIERCCAPLPFHGLMV
jgi:hypothetical protein